MKYICWFIQEINIKSMMKYLLIVIFLLLSINVTAQNVVVDANVFIRIYNLEGGKIKSISKTSIELYSRKKKYQFL